MNLSYLIALVPFIFAVPASAKTFNIDAGHSAVNFKVRYLMSSVGGRIQAYGGTVEYEKDKPETWKVDAELEAKSLNTNNDKRDAHLRNADFLDVERCPKMTFKSTKVTDVKGKAAKLHGDLTIRCKTKPVVLDLLIGGAMKNPYGGTGELFSATAKTRINRKDWDVSWNAAIEAGGMMVGDEVDIELEIMAETPKEEKKK